jgi:hypothetical protein
VFHMEPKTYRDAMKTCKAVWPLASLVAIESSVEQTIISNMINQSNGGLLLTFVKSNVRLLLTFVKHTAFQ